jgi:uncharacterized protein (DUF1697 family)
MTVIISMLRGINLGSHKRVKMDALRACYESMKLRDPQTYVQSGNVIFATREPDLERLARLIEKGIAQTFGFRSDVVLRTAPGLRDVVARNPFAKRNGIEPGKLIVTFLATDPEAEARSAVLKIKAGPEELKLSGRELYTYFPDGMGRSKLPWASVEKMFKTTVTSRNWNTVLNMLTIAEKIESSL